MKKISALQAARLVGLDRCKEIVDQGVGEEGVGVWRTKAGEWYADDDTLNRYTARAEAVVNWDKAQDEVIQLLKTVGFGTFGVEPIVKLKFNPTDNYAPVIRITGVYRYPIGRLANIKAGRIKDAARAMYELSRGRKHKVLVWYRNSSCVGIRCNGALEDAPQVLAKGDNAFAATLELARKIVVAHIEEALK